MNPTHSSTPRRRRLSITTVAAVAGLALAAGAAGVVVAQAGPGDHRPSFPSSPDLESRSGVKFVRATLAADGGLLDIRYVVINAPNAQRWLADSATPPTLTDQRNGVVIDRVAPMRDAHQQRPGQTYFLIYQNVHDAIHRGDLLDLTVAGTTLHGVPVE